MAWRNRVNLKLARTAGFRLRQRDGRVRLERVPQRQLNSPAFIFSSVRSGSTLLRMILNSHSAIYAPHELHLLHVRATTGIPAAEKAVSALGLTERDLTDMLWDRLLATALERSGKSVLVEKTPSSVLAWKHVVRCWPDARFVFLLRHPAAILDSWQRARTGQTEQEAVASITRYLTALHTARQELPGLTVRYEDLTARPEAEARRLCEFLGVAFEPAMVKYGEADHGPLVAGLGDWQDTIRTGEVQGARPVPDAALPPELAALARELGY